MLTYFSRIHGVREVERFDYILDFYAYVVDIRANKKYPFVHARVVIRGRPKTCVFV